MKKIKYCLSLFIALVGIALSSCEFSLSNFSDASHTWDEGSVTKEPTCLQEGVKTYVCLDCGKSKTETIPALGHSFTNYISNNDATCTEDGTKTAKCDRCDAINTITDPGSAKGHVASDSVQENVVPATCLEEGSCEEVVYCLECHKELSRENKVIPALGHSFTNYISNNDATCTEDGTKTAKCDRCDATDTVVDLNSATGHTPGTPVKENVIEATCTEEGSYEEVIYCSVCRAEISREDKTIKALGHDYKTYTSNNDATSVSVGSKSSVCSRCGKVKTLIDESTKTQAYRMEDYCKNNYYLLDCLPSKGSVNMLVVPLWLSDSGNFVSNSLKNRLRDDLNNAFFGSEESTGWESVASYYKQESNGELEIQGVVTDFWTPGYLSGYTTDESHVTSLMNEALAWYGADHDITRFDLDHNGFIDAMVMIYCLPDYCACSYSTDCSNLWAYCAEPQQASGTASNPNVGQYMWASYDFMYGSKQSQYYNGDTSHCSIDAHTYIHETGHLFGLTDYYDYNNVYDAVGGFGMQCDNVGDHDPVSKFLIGWNNPYVPSESMTIFLRPSATSGDAILLSPSFDGSPFDEYLMIDYYTPTGLNEFDSKNKYKSVGYSYPQGPSESGIRLWHADNRLTHGRTLFGLPVWSSSLNSTPSSDCYFAMSNTSYLMGGDSGHLSVVGDYDYRQLQLIRQNYTSDEKCNSAFDADSLFVENDTFTMEKYGSCFVNKGKLNSGKKLNWSFTVLDISEEGATIQITKTA